MRGRKFLKYRFFWASFVSSLYTFFSFTLFLALHYPCEQRPACCACPVCLVREISCSGNSGSILLRPGAPTAGRLVMIVFSSCCFHTFSKSPWLARRSSSNSLGQQGAGQSMVLVFPFFLPLGEFFFFFADANFGRFLRNFP